MFTKHMALGATISVNTDGAVASTKNLKKGFDGLDESFGRMASTITRSAAAFGVATYGFALLTDEALQYQKAIQQAFALSDQTRPDFDRDTAGLRALSDQTGVSSKDMADGMARIAAAGMYGAEGMAALEAATWGSIAAGMGMEETTEGMMSVLSQYQMSGFEAAKTIDILAKASNITSATMSSLFAGMKQAGTSMYMVKTPIEEVVGTLAAMNQIGLKDTMAGRGLSQVFQRLAAEPKAAAEELAKIGAEYKLTAEGGLDLLGTLESLANGMKMYKGDAKEYEKAAKYLFGAEHGKSGKGLLMLLESTDPRTSLRGIIESLKEAGGEAKRVAGIKMDNLIDQFKLLKNQIKNAFIFTLLPILNDLVLPAMRSVTEYFLSMSDGTKEAIGSLIIYGGIAVTATFIMLTLAAAIMGVQLALASFSAVGLAIAVIVGSFVLVFLALAFALVEVYRTGTGANTILKQLMESIGIGAEGVRLCTNLVELFSTAFDALSVSADRSNTSIGEVKESVGALGIVIGWINSLLKTMNDYIERSINGWRKLAAWKRGDLTVSLTEAGEAAKKEGELISKSGSFGWSSPTLMAGSLIFTGDETREANIDSARRNSKFKFMRDPAEPGMSTGSQGLWLSTDSESRPFSSFDTSGKDPFSSRYEEFKAANKIADDKAEEKTMSAKLEACIQNVMNVDGKAVAQSVNNYEINLAERGGASVSPYQRREVAANGAISRTA